MIYAFVFLVGLLAVGIYLVFALGEVPGMSAERLGELEPLPDDVNQWRAAAGGAPGAEEGEYREERLFHDAESGRLFRQVRFRAGPAGEILRVLPDQPVKRRRIRR